MKLSEAIRIGSTLAPQGFGRYKDVAGRTCALGAAQAASALRNEIVENGSECAPSPCECYGTIYPVESVIIHLNDHHRWTREQIADWVETVERDRAAGVPMWRAPAGTVPAVVVEEELALV